MNLCGTGFESSSHGGADTLRDIAAWCVRQCSYVIWDLVATTPLPYFESQLENGYPRRGFCRVLPVLSKRKLSC